MPINFNMPPSEFETTIQGNRPYVFKKAVRDHLIDWKLINELIARHDHTSSNFKIMKNGLIKKSEYLEEYQEVFTKKYRILKPVLYELMRNGASLVLNKIEGCAIIDQLQRSVAQYCRRQTVVSGYAAFGEETSFGNHWDTHDVFAIQIIGKKNWTIYRPTEVDPDYRNSSVGKEHFCEKISYLEMTLEAGDILYLPRGWWHEVNPTGVETFHLAIGTYPAYASDYFNWMNGKCFSENPIFRTALTGTDVDLETLKCCTELLSQTTDLDRRYQEFRAHFTGTQRLASTYSIEQFGNKNALPLPADTQICINANDPWLWTNDGYLANGVHLKTDDQIRNIITDIASNPGITLSSLEEGLPSAFKPGLSDIINYLINQDVISISK